VNTHYRSWRSTGSLVHEFISLEEPDMLEFVLEKGARVDIAEELGMTPLSFLFDRGIDDIHYFELLLRFESDVNARSEHDWGNTVLMEAARDNNMELVRLLLDYGADINEISSNFDQTALCFSYRWNNDNNETGAYLIAQGAEYTEERENRILYSGFDIRTYDRLNHI
jgi:ankyrin repeat protein